MQLVAWGQSHVGQRDHNEDAFLIVPEQGLFAVADGLGGKDAGDFAAKIVLERVGARFKSLYDQTTRASTPVIASQAMSAISGAINEASESIYQRRQEDRSRSGMSSTALVLQINEATGIVGHVGDSRLFLIRSGTIYQITEDHTMLQEVINWGRLSPEEIKKFPHRNVLCRSVGSNPTVNVDVLNVDVRDGDRFVLCSDGLSDVLSAEDIHEIASRAHPEQATQKLVRMANQRAARDNITVIVVEVQKVQQMLHTLPTEEKAALLHGVFLFEELTFQEILRVLAAVREIRFRDRETIIVEGEPGSDLFILVSGEVIVSRDGVALSKIAAGGHFGEFGLVSDGVRSATVTAVGDASVLAISRDDFYDIVSHDHTLSVKLLWRFLLTVTHRMKDLSATFTESARDHSRH